MADQMIGSEKFYTAMDKVKRLTFFRYLIKRGENQCFRCEQPIIVFEQLEFDHKIPWRNKDNKEEGLFLLEDINNHTVSHHQCNTNDTVDNKTGYKNVYQHEYWYKGKFQKFTYRAKMGFEGKQIGFGYYDYPKQAAMARDIGAMKLYDGAIVLNFPELRTFYNERIKDNDLRFIEQTK